jgi:dTDP-6-deoxy-L-talose 4-dehydrogenase (NAD+)
VNKQLINKKIAITGGVGFIGSNVVNLLALIPNIDIVIMVRRIKPNHISRLNIKYVELDINSKQDHERSYEILNYPDILINLAWENLADYNSHQHVGQILENQYLFLSNMIKQGLKTLINTGTCLEYGMVSGALDESLEPQPINAYAEGKDLLRRKLQFLKESYKFNFVWLRLFYIFGESGNQRGLYHQFMSACKKFEPVFNMSGGKQIRDYLNVEEVAAYIVKIAMLEQDFGTVNVCSGEPISIISLVQRWRTDYGCNIELNVGYYPYLDYEPMEFWGTNYKLKKILSV